MLRFISAAVLRDCVDPCHPGPQFAGIGMRLRGAVCSAEESRRLWSCQK